MHRAAWVLCVCLLFLWFLGGRLNRQNGQLGQAPAPESAPDAGDTHRLYTVTKDGVTEEDTGEAAEEYSDKMFKETVEFFDLDNSLGARRKGPDGEDTDVVLFLMPLRNAEHVLPMAFHNLMNLTYDHSLIDIAFLVSDCSPGDTTLQTVFDFSVALQNGTLADDMLSAEQAKKDSNVKGTNELYQLYMDQDYMDNVHRAYNSPESYHKGYRTPFRSVSIYVKDFGQVVGQGFSDRHAVKVQGIRRKLMGRARNWLTASALQADHSWVYWRDVDIETCPGLVIQDLMKFDYDVMVPNIWRPLPTYLGGEQPYDLNSWIESEPALELAKKLDEDDVIVEGYAEYPTYRVHLAYIRDSEGNPDEVVDLDGVGGVSILAKAKIFRQGVNFPAFTLWNHAETEAFGKLARRMGFKVGGLPHYTIWHIYEPSEDDLKHIAQLERKKRREKKH
ncbi:hypothetical protein METBIDRAFT_39416 [Metschnikowia bicuspidata var. bicuspidata NRRL YB-4993]|uniref:Vanadate resistance protein n=1 Tax=Metschnikowia bicuspidata var. bicuspidata NRRL YB-4993 TaxID=869754 RepID=A0A1A0HF16_9ASCO|nr:hypothetical protein METBIDRAFT_39416 [Metschnikowia bicuspidata var. bicuspidata NRRL YB-4993]OBA22596.1 hypothetical protein METBIDRAFT_39416 [Metschnikowia bicuspidata var. bicuspidata NRRL YB-4993]